MNFKGNHLVSTEQFDRESLFLLFEEAEKMQKVLSEGGTDLLKHKVMATLFFEPSTRTRFSFETAMLRLGGKVITNADMLSTSSVTKLESLYDTGKTISQMADVIVMRHPEVGSVEELANGSDVPVLNAGEGAHRHPTQGLLDVYTIWKCFNGLDDLTIGLIGDLKNSRVQHSQIGLLKHFDCKFIFVAPEGLEMPEKVVEHLKDAGDKVTVTTNMEEVLPEMDVISMSRIQKERFADPEEYQRYRGAYVLDAKLMGSAKNDAIVIHPLPRVDEIAVEVDSDPRAKYFEQIRNGLAIRMALLKLILA